MRTTAEMASASEQCMARAQWQGALFAERLRRPDLLSLPVPGWPLRKFRLRVHRNHAFEFVAGAMEPFLAYAGFEAAIDLSDYDDALSFAGVNGSAKSDVELLWLDFGRYEDRLKASEIGSWLKQRLGALREKCGDGQILVTGAVGPGAAEVNPELRRAVGHVPGARLVDLEGVWKQFGNSFFTDEARSRATGSRFGNQAQLEIARLLGLVALPAALAPRLKAVVVDLDQTLYRGVLGEDGPEGVSLDGGYREFQRELLALRDAGVFLALASKNDPEDVKALFSGRNDFPLKLADFTAVSVGWHAKSEAIRDVAAKLRIGTDAVVFVDDNAGELAQVAAEVPGIHCIHAGIGSNTARVLRFFPRLHGYAAGEADRLRAKDLAASDERAALAAEAASPAAYLRSLGVKLIFAMNPREQLQRMYELSQKTNQFNLALARLGEAEIARRLSDRAHRLVTVAMSDRLADAGIIALIAGRREGDTLLIDELAVSCRALGRGIEDVMITEALRRMAAELGERVRRIGFRFVPAPRNAPAREWLARYAGVDPRQDSFTMIEWDESAAHRLVSDFPGETLWATEEGVRL